MILVSCLLLELVASEKIETCRGPWTEMGVSCNWECDGAAGPDFDFVAGTTGRRVNSLDKYK